MVHDNYSGYCLDQAMTKRVLSMAEQALVRGTNRVPTGEYNVFLLKENYESHGKEAKRIPFVFAAILLEPEKKIWGGPQACFAVGKSPTLVRNGSDALWRAG